jgi:NAD(P)-dependent dehydrogenase (short-subunit alcohol dehydrogenase family)
MKLTWLLSKFCLKHMKANNMGRIVVISSHSTLGQGVEGQSLYLASKAAVNAFVKSLARETRRNNIKVNALLPTIIDTSANRAMMPGANYMDWVPPEHVADALFAMLSDSTAALNGALIPVPGRM